MLLLPKFDNLINRDSISLDPQILVLELFDRGGLQDVGQPARRRLG